MDKSDIRAGKVPRSEIPSYVLYGDPYGSAFPDCLHYETLADRSSLHDWRIRPHRHYGLHQFFWIEKGAVTATNDSLRHVLVAPAAIMSAPTAVHGFEFEPGSDGHVITIPTVNLERSLPQPSVLLGRLGHPIFMQCGGADHPDGSGISSIFAALAREYCERNEGRAEALLCLAGLVALWFVREAGRRTKDGHLAERPQVALVRRFLALIEHHFREHRPVSFYAQKLDVTARHLSRLCRHQLGLSAQEAIHNRLLLEARRILAYTPASIIHLAEDLGFRDPAYFTRFFTSRVGETPTSFRRTFVNHGPDS